MTPPLSKPGGPEALSESPRCNDMVADLHFPRFFGMAIKCEIARRFPRSVAKVGMQKYQYFEWGSTLNLDGFKIIIFQYIICEPFRSWKEGLVKLDVNLWEIWRKFKCHRSMSYPPWSKLKKWWPPTYATIMIIPNNNTISNCITEIWLTHGSSVHFRGWSPRKLMGF